MKQLNAKEILAVAGGDYTLTLQLHVPAEEGWQVFSMFAAVISGQIGNTADFVNALNQAGPVLDHVRITDIRFTNFN